MIFTHWKNNGKYCFPVVFLHFLTWLGDFSMVLFQAVQTPRDSWRNGSGLWRSQLVATSPAKALHEQFLATMGKTRGKPYVHHIFLWFSYMGEHIIRWKPMVKQLGKHRNTFKKMGQKSNKIRDICELCKWRFIAGKTIEVNGDVFPACLITGKSFNSAGGNSSGYNMISDIYMYIYIWEHNQKHWDIMVIE